jgi:hypothetical protein
MQHPVGEALFLSGTLSDFEEVPDREPGPNWGRGELFLYKIS